MIDWLDVEIPFKHRPIPQGRKMLIDHEGEIIFESPCLRSIENEFDEGSYSSRIAISSGESPWSIAKVPDISAGGEYCSAIYIKGNPTKYIQGHNIFGLSCIRSLLIAVIKDAFPKVGFDDFSVAAIIRRVQMWQFRVTRIDITKMFDLGSDTAVNEYLLMMSKTVSVRGDRCEFDRNTFYIGKHSGLWSLKFYNKYKELCSRSNKHRLPDFLPEELKNFAAGQLRAELCLRKMALDRLELTDEPELLELMIDEIFNEYAEKMTMKNQTINEKDYAALSLAYLGTIQRWKQGAHLKSELPRETYYRHRRRLLAIGIDISKPPIALDERVAIVKPLKLLAPKEIQTIPTQFYPYLIKQAV